jgi:predicted NBD/HSP70 family sugar kinase
MSAQRTIGVDVGGTKIVVALVDFEALDNAGLSTAGR